jgi:hypothetical protein
LSYPPLPVVITAIIVALLLRIELVSPGFFDLPTATEPKYG